MARKPLPVIEDIPDNLGLDAKAIEQLRQGCLFAGYLVHRDHRRAALATVAALDAPVWGYLDNADTEGSFDHARPAFAMLRFPFAMSPNRLPNNFPDYTPGEMPKLLNTAIGAPDRSFHTVRIPDRALKPDAQTKVALFSYMGMVRFFEESARIFPERQTPLPFTPKGRRLIMRHWRARQAELAAR